MYKEGVSEGALSIFIYVSSYDSDVKQMFLTEIITLVLNIGDDVGIQLSKLYVGYAL